MLTIFKSFLIPQLDYGDVIYDRAFNQSFQNKLESVQYNAALAITGTITEAYRGGVDGCGRPPLSKKVPFLKKKIK